MPQYTGRTEEDSAQVSLHEFWWFYTSQILLVGEAGCTKLSWVLKLHLCIMYCADLLWCSSFNQHFFFFFFLYVSAERHQLPLLVWIFSFPSCSNLLGLLAIFCPGVACHWNDCLCCMFILLDLHVLFCSVHLVQHVEVHQGLWARDCHCYPHLQNVAALLGQWLCPLQGNFTTSSTCRNTEL